MICKELTIGATLDQVLCICPGRWPIKSCTEGLAYERPICGMVAAESGMNFVQELPPFLFGDAPLEYFGSTFLVEFPFVYFVSFRMPDYAACFILVFGELLPI